MYGGAIRRIAAPVIRLRAHGITAGTLVEVNGSRLASQLSDLLDLDYRWLTGPVERAAVKEYKAAHDAPGPRTELDAAFGKRQWERRLRLESFAADNALIYTPEVGTDPLVAAGLFGGYKPRACVVDFLSTVDGGVTIFDYGRYSRSPSPSRWETFVTVKLGEESRPGLTVGHREHPKKDAAGEFEANFEFSADGAWDTGIALDEGRAAEFGEVLERGGGGYLAAFRTFRDWRKDGGEALRTDVFTPDIRQLMVENMLGSDVHVAKGTMFLGREVTETDLLTAELLRKQISAAVALAPALEAVTRSITPPGRR
jgi:hypothetical protein